MSDSRHVLGADFPSDDPADLRFVFANQQLEVVHRPVQDVSNDLGVVDAGSEGALTVAAVRERFAAPGEGKDDHAH